MKKVIIQVVLSVLIIVLGYLVYESIMAPVRFNKEYRKRSELVIERMKHIRTAQLIYKSIHGKYTGSFDTLVAFMETGQVPVVKMVPDPNDTTFTRSIQDTVGYINVGDSIFGPDADLSLVRFIPYTENEPIELQAGTITKSNIQVSVFQALAPKEKFLLGLDKHLIGQDKVKSIKVGSMEEPSTDGNWE
ncbi:MAG TPA: hypothetical protein P5550_00595 [Bacteroidales bacterium]|nr:hypothetical protein [Bacteroidales bacterium]